MELAEYIKSVRKDIVFDATLRDLPFTFQSTWGVFSPREIDEGSRLLLDYVEVNPTDHCFDLGCGYGPLGLTLARLAPQGETLLVDKDFVAVEYARKNAQRNRVTNATVLLSNGFDQVGERRFDLVVSNIPAKVGKEMLYILLYDAYQHLKPGGRIYVVTITGLRRFIARAFDEVFGNYEKVKQGKSYTVALAHKTS
jgi:16S rRNA (guanine1207-N2)-methyltransferase